MNNNFWLGKKVLVTGHTGFKGSWLSLWLYLLGANVTGYALNPPTNPSLYHLANIKELLHDIRGDIRDRELLYNTIKNLKPDVVFHLAAQPLVGQSYQHPVETYETNVMGTVNLLDCIREIGGIGAVINVTTDKCYENQEWFWGYRENDRLGGFDPYSNSKACSELVTEAYRNSYFNPQHYSSHGVALATARAGNVIGGGDFAQDRLIPDIIRSILQGEDLILRNPQAIRPWQHVLEPLAGYLLLAEGLYNQGAKYASSWNFGPDDADSQSVEWIQQNLYALLQQKRSYITMPVAQYHEAGWLRLDCSKAKHLLGWKPVWNLMQCLEKIVEWLDVFQQSGDLQNICKQQILGYMQERESLNE